jgi:two-component system sensor histidine kinase ResE
MIKRETLRLAKMTKDFLDFARLESGRVRLARQTIDIAILIYEVVRLAQPQAATRQITIDTALSPDLPTMTSKPGLIGDSDRLKQVILNLVSNAIKYNVANGRITISAKLNDQEVVLSVADTGHGIDPEDVTHLFERFYRVPTSEGVSEGSGLGLAIAQKIVQEHGGRIELESVVGQGTTFTIFLPLRF